MRSSTAKRTLHLISHTHWDREWYLPFQLFRLQLVPLVDDLLEILDSDPQYKHFTLDGQTIVLDDYLHMRPEAESKIRDYVQNGRLLIGPWYILPDEFLVSPEATVRNLLHGDRHARKFGPKMAVGYIPDPFGHVGQMPQILRGFGIDNACLQRGVADEPCEFWWQAPDGSRVLVANLRDGYMNAVRLPTSQADAFVNEIHRLRDSLLPHAATDHLLLMQGNDHTPPDPDTSEAVRTANRRLEHDVILHSSLPGYIRSIQSQIASEGLSIPIVEGELRSCQRHHLLPGVYSTRMWIKQRNHHCETLLEKWAEPFSTWASAWKQEDPAAAIIRRTWQLLMECHPHDSICGCSVDQVHREMRPRFDQVEQVAEELTRQSLVELAGDTETLPASGQNPDDFLAVVVYNPTASLRTELVPVEVELPLDVDHFEFVTTGLAEIAYESLGTGRRDLLNVSLDRETISAALNLIQDGRAAGFAIQSTKFKQSDHQLHINIVLSETGEPDLSVWRHAQEEMQTYLANPEVEEFIIAARTPPSAKLVLLAEDVPAFGYRTCWARRRKSDGAPRKPVKVRRWVRPLVPIATSFSQLGLLKDKIWPSTSRQSGDVVPAKPPYVIENDYFHVEAAARDGTLTIFDKRTGAVYQGLNRFTDGGDSGDEYNYNPPSNDLIIDRAQVRNVQVHQDQVQQFIDIHLTLNVPKKLSRDRQSRSIAKATLDIKTRINLVMGVPRIDVRTEVDNGEPPIQDHRLRVYFPASFDTDIASYDGHFEIVDRPIDLPEYDSTWIEQPRPEKPQRSFASLSDGKIGLTIANRGLPEVEALRNARGNAEIAITLLRCVGWLSREDLSTRTGHAGPMIATPEAQMPGKHNFEYAIIPHAGDWRQAYLHAYAFDAPLKAVSTDLHAGWLPPTTSFITVDNQSFIITAIKPADDGTGWILRGFNLDPEPIEIQLSSVFKINRAAEVSLAEEIQHNLRVDDQKTVNHTVRGYAITTIKLW